jgi:hypothetical protein
MRSLFGVSLFFTIVFKIGSTEKVHLSLYSRNAKVRLKWVKKSVAKPLAKANIKIFNAFLNLDSTVGSNSIWLRSWW